VTLLATGQMLLLVRPDSPYQSLADLLAAARKAPGTLNFGAGSSSSLVASELLKQMADVKVTYIPYQSNPKSLADLLGGRIDFMFADAPTAIPQVQSGGLRPLAASGAKRLASMPDVPTVAEAGVKGYDMTYWFAAYLPAHAPAAVVQQLNQAFAKASDAPEVKAFRAKTSTEAELTTSEGLAKFQADESKKWGRVIGAAGIKPR
jgi:tripartite-type tricarboxylate transporter receptor subunit TctC